MRLTRKTVYGRIDNEGKLSCFMGELEQFAKLHPDRGVIIRVEVQPKEPTDRTRNYYYGYCVPEMQSAMLENGERYTKAQVDYIIRSACPLFFDEQWENGKYKYRIKEWDELDQAETNEFIEWLYQWAAENYSKILESPYGKDVD